MSNEENELYLAYITQLRSEHRHVKQCLTRVETQWQRFRQGPRAAGGIDELISSLTDLRAELAHHFAKEEVGGCVEEAVSHTPWLGREAAELERENPDLLQQLDRLIDKLRKAPKSLKRIEKEYRQLAEKLGEHEAAESRIVKESFGMDVD